MINPRNLLVGTAFILAVLGLAACASDPKSPAVHAVNPGALYVLKADATTDKIAMALHADGLSPAQTAALKELIERRAKVDGGVVTVSLPHGAADAAIAGRTADLVLALLNVQGAPTVRATYESDDPKAPMLVSFTYDKPEIPACGKHWDDLTHTRDNRVQSNFGCAVTANMAAQIANPTDLRHPRGEGPPDVERRMTVLGKYEAGKVTTADEPDAGPKGVVLAHIGQ